MAPPPTARSARGGTSAGGATVASFVRDRRTRQVVEPYLEIIGEAVNRLHRHDSDVVGRISADTPIVGLRNVRIRGNDVIGSSTVWLAVQESLPVLRAEVAQLLREVEER